MHLRRFWIALALFAPIATPAAVVYKWTDAAGTVHFSDQPVPGAEKIVTSGASANGIGGNNLASSNAASPNTAPTTPPAVSTLAIDSPAREQVFFGSDEVPVQLRIEPGLRPTQTVAWTLNGQRLDDQAPAALSFQLPMMPRGTYVIAASVTDSQTGETQTAADVTFYVRQPSELAPQHKKP